MTPEARPVTPVAVRVDLHCHSLCSDGKLTPEELAHRLAHDGVAFAALTDHETIAGQERFRHALHRYGIGSVGGVELAASWHGEEIHILAYGCVAGHPAMQALLNKNHAGAPTAPPPPAATLMEAVHRAGGRAFLAHPLFFRRDAAALRAALAELKKTGLDGVEAYYAPEPPHNHALVAAMADDLELLVSAGSDFHAPADHPAGGLGIGLPLRHWQKLRAALNLEAATVAAGDSAAYQRASRASRSFGLHVLLPAILAVSLFVAAIWLLLLPAVERALLDRKREMIRELTHSAWSILAEAERQAAAGRISREMAQREAIGNIAALRYGRENKDYFWLQDMSPKMVMHPYRSDLDGRDLSAFTDPRGARIFVEFAEMVRRHGEGYVDYVWQWPDDPHRLEPKESFVKGFAPWDWVIGTGLYMEDVRQQIAAVERGLVHTSLLISAVVALLLFHMVRHSRRLDSERAAAVEELRAASERYRALVEATTEGTLLLLDRHCRYANPRLLQLTGYDSAALELLDIAEILPAIPANAAAWEAFNTVSAHQAGATAPARAELRHRDGSAVAMAVSFAPVALGGREGVIMLARETAAAAAGATAAARPQPGDVARASRRITLTARTLHDSGAPPPSITRLVSATCDAATTQFISHALDELGPPPAAFAFVALGSQGRSEQTLVSDQDNAIIYEPQPGAAADAAIETYFLELGKRVCNWLNEAGYHLCAGGIMARNRDWCRTLADWKEQFTHWALRAEPMELMKISVVFDFRTVYGEPRLASEMRRHMFATLGAAPSFFPHFARHALTFRPPLIWFGRIIFGQARRAPSGTLDFKAATMPLAAFARLYALRHTISATNTLERLDALHAAGVLSASGRDEIHAAFNFLTGIRLRHQLGALSSSGAADNHVPLRRLNHMERAMLRQALKLITITQRRIAMEFLGGSL